MDNLFDFWLFNFLYHTGILLTSITISGFVYFTSKFSTNTISVKWPYNCRSYLLLPDDPPFLTLSLLSPCRTIYDDWSQFLYHQRSIYFSYSLPLFSFSRPTIWSTYSFSLFISFTLLNTIALVFGLLISSVPFHYFEFKICTIPSS